MLYTALLQTFLYLSIASSFSIQRLLGLDIDVRRAAALVTLRSHNLVVVVTKAHAGLVPSIEVVLHIDGATNALVAADGPVLVEGLDTIDGRLLVAGRHVEVVGVSVSVDGSLVLSIACGVVGSEVLDDLGGDS